MSVVPALSFNPRTIRLRTPVHGELLIMQTRKLEKSLRQEDSCQLNSVRNFCGIRLCIVLHCQAKWATGIPVIYVKKQNVSDWLANYEPDGRRFDSFRARHYSIQIYRLWRQAWPVCLWLFNRDKNIHSIGQVPSLLHLHLNG